MGTIGKNFKYKVINNFLNEDERILLENKCKIDHSLNTTNFDMSKITGNMDTSYYSDYVMEALLKSKLSLIEKETNKNLSPTYSYWRMYTKYSELLKHVDRSSCEISVIVNIGSDGTSWPIYIKGNPVNLKPGEAVIYLGCELFHWRKSFKGDWCAQVFLHYVDKNGKNKEWAYDKRRVLGEGEVI